MAYNKKTEMYEGYIYKITNDVNNKVYIGQTCTSIGVRWSGHLYQTKKHMPTDVLHNAMDKYGSQHFKIKMIYTIQAKAKRELLLLLDKYEIYYISKFDSYCNGYNLTRGGRGDKSHQMKSVVQYSPYGEYISTYESVNELSEIYDSISTIYDCCLHRSKYAYGYIWRYEGDNTDLQLSDVEIKECITRYLTKFEIKQYSWDGILVNSYKNVDDAVEQTGVKRSAIIGSCTGRNVYGDKYIWRFYCHEFNSHKTTKNKYRGVNQYNVEGNFIKSYRSVREAARDNNMHYQTICGVCNKKKKTSGGYIWFFADDVLQPDKTKIIERSA